MATKCLGYLIVFLVFQCSVLTDGLPDETTTEDSPLEAPGNFALDEILNGKTALFTWSPVSPESVRGTFKGYKIQTWTDRGGEASMIEIKMNPGSNRGLVTKLIPYSKNYARILAYNTRFDGPPSNTLSFDMPEGTPGAVHAQAYPMGSSAFYLTWKSPEYPNGILTGYKIYLQGIRGTTVGPRIGDGTTVGPEKTGLKLVGLEPNMKYRLTVVAMTKEGEGEEMFIESRTREATLAPPNVPNFKVTPINQDSIRVTWLLSLEQKEGSHFYVKYKLKEEDQYSNTDPEMESDSIVINGLSPKVYEVILVSVDEEYSTEGAVQEIDLS